MHFRTAACAFACVITILSPASARDLSESDYARANAVLLEGYVLPRAEALARITATLSASTVQFCKARTGRVPDDAVARFDAAFDAWIRVRHLAFGPFEFFLRINRFQYSPDPGRRVARDLDALIARKDVASLAPREFAKGSVTLQGFPALEILFYDAKARVALQRSDGEGDYRCRLAQAIARNMAEMVAGVVADWRGGGAEPFLQVMTRPRPGNAYYQTHREVALQFFKNLYGGLDVLADVKLAPVLGPSLSEARPELEESPASGRSLAHVISSQQALEAFYTAGLEGLLRASGNDPGLVPLLRRAFRMTIATARGINVPLARAVADPAARRQVEKLLLQIRALKQLVSQRLSAATGLVVGFNALDGD
jgi:predicted lipoprotein